MWSCLHRPRFALPWAVAKLSSDASIGACITSDLSVDGATAWAILEPSSKVFCPHHDRPSVMISWSLLRPLCYYNLSCLSTYAEPKTTTIMTTRTAHLRCLFITNLCNVLCALQKHRMLLLSVEMASPAWASPSRPVRRTATAALGQGSPPEVLNHQIWLISPHSPLWPALMTQVWHFTW